MPLLLPIYLATEILAPFFASLLILNAILFLGKIVPLLDLIFAFEIGGGDFLRLCAYMMPKLLLFTIPMAGMTAVIIAATRMVNDNEIMALKACGTGFARLLPPVFAVALSCSLLAWFSASSLLPKGTVAMQGLFLHLASEKIDMGIKAGQFSEGLDRLVLSVEEVDAQSRELRGVYLSDLRHGPMPVVVTAQKGRLIVDPEKMEISIDLTNGNVNRATDKTSQTTSFERYQVAIPIKPPGEIGGTSLARTGKNALSQEQLLERAAALGKESPEGKSMLIEYHSRMALSAGALILALLGLPLALLNRPGHRPTGMPLGLLCFVLYYVVYTAGKTAAESGGLPVAAAIWLANGIFTLLTIWLSREVAHESQQRWFETFDSLWAGVQDRLRGLIIREHRS